MFIASNESGFIGFLISVYLMLACIFAAIVTVAAPFALPTPVNFVAGAFLLLVAGWALAEPERAALAAMAVTPAICGLGNAGWALAGFVWPSLALLFLYERTLTSAQLRARK